MAEYFVYIVECSDSTLYTGYAVDLRKRIEKHNSGMGAKYTRNRLPVELKYHETFATKSEALKREYAIKKLSRKAKIELMRRGNDASLCDGHADWKPGGYDIQGG